jgi:hypothetical protein
MTCRSIGLFMGKTVNCMRRLPTALRSRLSCPDRLISLTLSGNNGTDFCH